jgi:hypothetical protein
MPAAMGGFRRFGFAAATLLLCSGLVVSAASTASAATGARAADGHTAGTKAPSAHRATGHSTKSGPAPSPDISAVAGARAASTPTGYSPADLQSAYNLTSASASGGKDATVAIIGAFDDPNAASDLAAYRTQYGLPPCTTASGCFSKVNENGQASPLPPTAPSIDGAEWAEAESADMDMVSAICPNCHILLVEISNYLKTNMGTAVDSAVAQGARYVVVGWSSYGLDQSTVEQEFDLPGVAITVPAGNSNFAQGNSTSTNSYSFPASLPYVTAVGGTTLSLASNSRGWSEAVWGSPGGGQGTASGCALEVGKPSWQTDTGCADRTYNDVAAVATGVPFYNTADGDTGWYDGASTTFSAAIIGAVYALAGTPEANTFPVTYPYLHTTGLYPVTNGSNGLNGACPGWATYLCTAGPGYNGPAGWGTPDGTAAFTQGDQDQVSLLYPGLQATTVTALPQTVSVPPKALDSAGNTLTYTATGLPPGLTIDPSTGVISGSLTHDYNGTTTVTATDTAGATASDSFPWGAENRLTIGSTGTQQTKPDTAYTGTVTAMDADPNATKTFSATGLPGLSIDPSTGLSPVPRRRRSAATRLPCPRRIPMAARPRVSSRGTSGTRSR